MLGESPEFLVVGTLEDGNGRSYVIARALDPTADFALTATSTLGTCPIERWLDIPRAADSQGNPRTDVFCFCLKHTSDRARFEEGRTIMPRVSVEVEKEVGRRFQPEDVPRVLSELAALDDPPPERPDWARERARVQLALVKLGDGDVAELSRHLERARRDYRDTLCAAGLEHDDWPEVLRAAGYLVPPLP
jgi:hypothetical protein